ncbi:MAG: hypothetical protein GTO63_08490 [Anaerolineae bacterium]|nr:hypothetical protein [Anaerolineae bacterium]
MAVDSVSAAAFLQNATIHAYVGGNPSFEGKIPSDVSYAESLKSYLVSTFNPASPSVKGREKRISAARKLVATLAGVEGAYVFHPYPVTPYHMDYLHHFDLAEASKEEYLHPSRGAQGEADLRLRVRAKGNLEQEIIRSLGDLEEKAWDATVEEVDIGDLVSSHTISLNGWLGPPWLHEGWFQAYLLLADKISDSARKQAVDENYQRLVRGDYDGVEERLNLERKLVSLLTQGYERIVIGYTMQREYYNREYSAGIENIAYDSQTGFNSAIFIRTVKLKDFPWNGWLRLGVESRPFAAWNPIGGFTDPAGRLIWFAVGDPAFFSAPYNGSWVPNRIGDFR